MISYDFTMLSAATPNKPDAAVASRLYLTAAALNGVPSWNLIPWFRWNVMDVPSGATSHDLASHPASCPFSSSLSRGSRQGSSDLVSKVPASAGGFKLLMVTSESRTNVPP